MDYIEWSIVLFLLYIEGRQQIIHRGENKSVGEMLERFYNDEQGGIY